MQILYTNEIFTIQRFGGISRYIVELINNLDDDVQYCLPMYMSDNEHLKDVNIVDPRGLFSNCKFKGRQRVISYLNNMALKRGCKKLDYDIVHPTYYNNTLFLDHIGNTPFVITVHDMIHELYPHFFKADDKTTANKKMLCEKATKIIAISNNTKSDIVKLFNIDPNKIEVVYHGKSFDANGQCEKTLNLPDKYILFTGQRPRYKNFNRFVEAFSKLDKEYHLVCTGSKFLEKANELIDKLSIKDRIHVMYVSDKELVEIYSRAELFVFPSEYEGFGLPILEAFATNCPIALSNASCFPEIAEDAGVYFDPLDVESIYLAMKSVLENNELRMQLIEKGRKQLSKFSWKRAAEETSAVYKSVIQENL